MKTYVSDLASNVEVTSFFLISDEPTVRTSKRGADYWSLKLQDKTGEVDARLWDIPPKLDPKQFKRCIVKVRGTVNEWNESKQVGITQMRLIEGADAVDMADFFECSLYDVEGMWSELKQIVGGVENGYVRQLLFSILSENEANFKKAPAAKSVHHNYLGGLLEHVLDMCRIADPICENYRLNRDLILAGCVCHDIGKLWELSYNFGTGYTVEGTLLGHISQGVVVISKAMDSLEGFPSELRTAIIHLVLSHHGLMAYGSPKVPLMREAIVLNLIDLLSSKMGICAKAIKVGVDPEGLTAWVKELEGPIWSPEWRNE